jgi:hypothetical protein
MSSKQIPTETTTAGKHASHHDPRYPSAEYLMRLLPKELHEHSPAALVALMTAPNHPRPPPDRITTVEVPSYRPARTRAEWVAIAYDGPSDEYNIEEIPWYRDGYSWIAPPAVAEAMDI